MGNYASEMMLPRKKEDWEKAGFTQDVESYRVSCGTCGAIINTQDWKKHRKWHTSLEVRMK